MIGMQLLRQMSEKSFDASDDPNTPKYNTYVFINPERREDLQFVGKAEQEEKRI